MQVWGSDMSDIGSKVNYVKAQPNRGNHTCHWPGCEKNVPAAMWGCSKHWYSLPQHLRSKIWATYKPGQEIFKSPSSDYLTAAKEVQEWIRSQGK